MSSNASVGEMSQKCVCTMDMKATESIHIGCGKVSCVDTDGTLCCPCLLKAHKVLG